MFYKRKFKEIEMLNSDKCWFWPTPPHPTHLSLKSKYLKTTIIKQQKSDKYDKLLKKQKWKYKQK